MSPNAVLIAIIKVAVLCLVVIGGIGLVLLFAVIPRQIRTLEVAVPNLVGQSHERAVHLINKTGLQPDPEVERKPSPDIPEGDVMEQEPPANFKVKLNKPIRLTLSMGTEAVPIPGVAGKLLNEAEKTLKNAGFRRGRVAAVHSDRYPEVNTVIAQTPRSGTARQRGAAVDLLLSLGVRSKVLRMPDLRRMSIDEVRSLLESHGLKIGEEVPKPHPEINEGLIIDHQPAAGELVPVGQVVNLEVSGSRRSTAEKGHLINVEYEVSAEGAPSKQVRIEIEDERGKRKVVNDSYQSGMLIEKPFFRVFGQAIMHVYEDNVLVKTEKVDW
ncbi:MAG: PASTA domain-containing protein [Candidatus Poribacteria bacterium]|nr:PASTA domain-containing protein [Candidatus Poribacteria bacterium]